MYQTLYRKWRPKTFDDVFGQSHITDILRYEIMQKKTTHAYLFCGSRGIGKTTCAKIMAKAINCESPINGSPCGECSSCRGIENGSITDVIEMDAASNNGVNDIRDIKESLDFVPAEVSKRVYIIDEVHMLSISAFNALLKTLEEPPEHAVFILATTELSKIPPTILSRCQRFDFRRIEANVMVQRLRQISESEMISVSDEALYLIARVANGGMRDAIGMLELCAGSNTDNTFIDEIKAARLIGVSDIETMSELVTSVLDENYDKLFEITDSISRGAIDFDAFWSNLMLFYRDLLVIKTTSDPSCFLELPPSHLSKMKEIAKRFSKSSLFYHMKILDNTYQTMSTNQISKRACAETGLIKMCDCKLNISADALLSRIEALETKIAKGNLTSPSTNEAQTAKVSQTIPSFENDTCHDSSEADVPAAPMQTSEYKKYNKWQDVIVRCSSSGGIFAMLKKCRAMISEDGSHFVVLSPDRVTLRMIQTDSAVSALLDALNTEAGFIKYSKDTLEMRITDSDNEEEQDLFTTLLEENT